MDNTPLESAIEAAEAELHLLDIGAASPGSETHEILRRLLTALSSPPADDVREEAERRWPVRVIGYTDSDGSRFEYESTENREFREAFIAGVEFEVRLRGTVTEEATNV